MIEKPEVCSLCQGAGWRMDCRDGQEVAVRCVCRQHRTRRVAARAARIPPRYAACTLDGFELWNPGDPTLRRARDRAREFVEVYPAVEKGLLFVGGAGTGKTHLATAVLRELVDRKGATGLYVDMLDLIQQLQMSFESTSITREAILAPVVQAEVLVLDELGAGKVSPWVMDLIYYIINTRYMRRRVTICTSNYRDTSGKAGEETLADRVSARVRSRLFEMCTVVELRGTDFRQRVLAEKEGRRS